MPYSWSQFFIIKNILCIFVCYLYAQNVLVIIFNSEEVYSSDSEHTLFGRKEQDRQKRKEKTHATRMLYITYKIFFFINRSCFQKISSHKYILLFYSFSLLLYSTSTIYS